MKQFVKVFCLMAVVALAFTSCKKSDQKAVSFNGATQQFVVEDDGSKAYLDDAYYMNFEQGDVVKLFNISSTPSNSECADYSATSTGQRVIFQAVGNMAVQTKGSFYGFYPAETVTPNLSNENRATFTLREEQVYREVDGKPAISKGDLYMAAKVDDVQNITDADFYFQNICGILSLKYYDTKSNEPWVIKSITVYDKHFNLTGDVNLKVDKVTTEGLVALCEEYNPANPAATAALIANYKDEIGYNVTNAGDHVTLTFGSEGFALSQDANNPSRFFFVLRPLALSHGYRVVVTDMNDDEYEVVNSNTNKKIKPNTIIGNSAKDLKNYH